MKSFLTMPPFLKQSMDYLKSSRMEIDFREAFYIYLGFVFGCYLIDIYKGAKKEESL